MRPSCLQVTRPTAMLKCSIIFIIFKSQRIVSRVSESPAFYDNGRFPPIKTYEMPSLKRNVQIINCSDQLLGLMQHDFLVILHVNLGNFILGESVNKKHKNSRKYK